MKAVSPRRRLAAEPQRFGFDAAVRVLQHAGREADPCAAARFRSIPGLAYAPADVIELDTGGEDARPRLAVSVMGLTGPSGVLPRYFTEAVNASLRERSRSMHAFLDLLSHRLVAHFAQAGAKVPPASHRRDRRAGAQAARLRRADLRPSCADRLRHPGAGRAGGDRDGADPALRGDLRRPPAFGQPIAGSGVGLAWAGSGSAAIRRDLAADPPGSADAARRRGRRGSVRSAGTGGDARVASVGRTGLRRSPRRPTRPREFRGAAAGRPDLGEIYIVSTRHIWGWRRVSPSIRCWRHRTCPRPGSPRTESGGRAWAGTLGSPPPTWFGRRTAKRRCSPRGAGTDEPRRAMRSQLS